MKAIVTIKIECEVRDSDSDMEVVASTLATGAKRAVDQSREPKLIALEAEAIVKKTY